ncbi:class I SAM-dependent DNA methyltransferase [Natranaerobius thermophilus JW/NM-WN-LF]|uniref:site-specific DNA-methyltransferase (adenine-specific) n=1 Tax=Natranaerobius thermophilus (strain ATCC BAA-1301 / DSM 18059 / JW/NM-WN-LF) TaxID=457570 RepID=B2A7T0_NATTJ|nr:class I SAM-dependent DNA methyltransferase [Natranaerobius thermophilus]ACB84382.1 N-6 DNA methylase [Natranaerobius thermophilus JW/NM-WN-LF]
MNIASFQEKVNFIWSIADLLRGDYKRSDYGKVILPFTVLKRLDCALKPTKNKVLEEYKMLKDSGIQNPEPVLNDITGQHFHNTSQFDFEKMKNEPDNIGDNLRHYINGFSTNARDIIEYFNFHDHLERLEQSNLLYLIVSRFSEIDLSPEKVSNLEMGYIFEELIRKFSEQSNETAGEHFTPREVIRLMVNLLFNEDSDLLQKEGLLRTIYDPACGTGGMLSVARDYLRELNNDAKLEMFGQELNPESYAICKADMMIKGLDPDNIKFGNSFTNDGFSDNTFDYMLSNPPFGVEWKKIEKEIKEEHENLGFSGRYGAGLPRINDGSILFLQHMISKMQHQNGGSRIAIVLNGSPLFTGDAGQGESNIRKWIIENDLLEAIVALPEQLFYNTGINTYVWVLTNRKRPWRKGKIQLINAVEFYKKMRKSLGEKRHEISPEQIDKISKIYGEFKEGEYSKIFDNEDFGYYKITVERPLRLNFQASDERIERLKEQRAFQNLAKSKKKDPAKKEEEINEGEEQQEAIINVLKSMDETVYKNREEFTKILDEALKDAGIKLKASLKKAVLKALSEQDETAEICTDSKGNPEPDPDLRDNEIVSLKDDINGYFEREVKPHVPDAWIDESKTKIGYEIPFTRHFYKYEPPREPEVIMEEIIELEHDIKEELKKVIGNGEI